MRARELMTQPVVSIHRKTPLSEIARTMVDRRIGCVPVVDELGKLRGIVTLTDFAAKEHGVPFSIENLRRGSTLCCPIRRGPSFTTKHGRPRRRRS